MPGGEIAGLLVDVAVGLAAGLCEIAAVILWASIRPWKYVFSKTYRLEIQQQLSSHGVLSRWFYLGWGFAALLLSLMVILAGILLVLSIRESSLERQRAEQKRLEDLRREGLQKAQHFFEEKVKSR